MGCVNAKLPPDRELEGRQASDVIPDNPMAKRQGKVERWVSFSSHAFDAQYQIVRTIGSGAFGTVLECVRKSSGERVAVKALQYRKGAPEARDALTREVDMLRELDHPNIVRLLDFLSEGSRAFIVMELADGGDLFDSITSKDQSGDPYTEEEARGLARAMFGALAHCHQRHVVHRDLKPENILLENKLPGARIKLADFGLAKHYETQDGLMTECGTLGYTAPELLKGVGYGPAVDVWSAAVILYILLSGYNPFQDSSMNEATIRRRIVEGDWSFDIDVWDVVSEEAKDLLRKTLVVDPHTRLTTEEVLKHKWFEVDSAALSSRSLDRALSNLKDGRQRLRGAVNAVIALKRLGQVGQ